MENEKRSLKIVVFWYENLNHLFLYAPEHSVSSFNPLTLQSVVCTESGSFKQRMEKRESQMEILYNCSMNFQLWGLTNEKKWCIIIVLLRQIPPKRRKNSVGKEKKKEERI